MRAALMLFVLCLGCCAPALVDEPWLVTGARVVAVTAEPPEAAPGATVALRAVVARATGSIEQEGVRWASCDQPRAYSQNEPVNPNCLGALSAAPIGASATEVVLSGDICARFGPDAPSAGVRPRDPDATGGYYLPVGVQVGEAPAFAFVRLRCQPAGISFEVAQAYRRQARPNTNPTFVLSAFVEGTPTSFDALAASASVELRADWSASPEETFSVIDSATSTLTTHIERYDVSWFVTAGRLSSARSSTGTGRWQLPSAPGQGALWAVVRDNRGGVAVTAAPVSWH